MHAFCDQGHPMNCYSKYLLFRDYLAGWQLYDYDYDKLL